MIDVAKLKVLMADRNTTGSESCKTVLFIINETILMHAIIRRNVPLQGAIYRIDAVVASMGEDAGGIFGTAASISFPTPEGNDFP
jgi:hypothetical protein